MSKRNGANERDGEINFAESKKKTIVKCNHYSYAQNVEYFKTIQTNVISLTAGSSFDWKIPTKCK